MYSPKAMHNLQGDLIRSSQAGVKAGKNHTTVHKLSRLRSNTRGRILKPRLTRVHLLRPGHAVLCLR